jgi:antitoxin component YwqK of YwqJK toxin-antitoxin module
MANVRSKKSTLKFALLLVLAAAIVIAFFSFQNKPEKVIEIPREELALRNGRLFRINETSPFTGIMIEVHPDGSLKSRSFVAEGLLEGVSEGWYTNGVIQVRENFKQGISHGLRTKWHENGKLMSESTIEQGNHHGIFRRWHENGQLAEEVTLVHGKPDGVSQSYHPTGYLKARVVLKMGEVVEQMFWKDGEKLLADAGGSQ